MKRGKIKEETKTCDNYRLWQVPQMKPTRCQDGDNVAMRACFRPSVQEDESEGVILRAKMREHLGSESFIFKS